MVSGTHGTVKSYGEQGSLFPGKMHSVKMKPGPGPWSCFRSERDVIEEAEDASKAQREHKAETLQFTQSVCLQEVKGSTYKPRWPGLPDQLLLAFLFVAG